jgi:transposase
MSFEQAIHEQWAQDAALTALLPAERVSTGQAVDPTRPYATLTCPRRRTATRTNAGDAIDEVTLRINVWHDSYDAGRVILDQLKASFDWRDFPLAEGRRVVQMRRDRESVAQQDDGVWHLWIEFSVLVYLPTGDWI